MSGLQGLLLAGIGFLVIVVGFILLSRRGEDGGSSSQAGPQKRKDRNQLIKAANKRLAQNPRDAEARLELADIYFQEQSWDESVKHYKSLVEQVATNKDLDERFLSIRYGISLIGLRRYDEAYKTLMVAYSMNNEGFEINYHLGYLEYQRREYEKAAVLLNRARKEQSEHVLTARYLGLALFKARKFSEALSALTTVIQHEPGDKEALFALGQSYFEVGNSERALRVFSHLRADPKLGPRSALFAGTIHMKQNAPAKAAMDFEIGLRHEEIEPVIAMELKYRLAAAYIQQKDIDKALELLREIAKVNAEYKDVQEQLARYQEMANNRLLQTYTMAPNSEFVGLCRRIAGSYFHDAKTKIIDISIRPGEWVDVLAEVNTQKWEDHVLFRFMRTSGAVGELVLREHYSRIRDLRAGRGFCMTVGTFTEGAQQFVEARLIDLIDKEGLMKIFNRLGRRAPAEAY